MVGVFVVVFVLVFVGILVGWVATKDPTISVIKLHWGLPKPVVRS